MASGSFSCGATPWSSCKVPLTLLTQGPGVVTPMADRKKAPVPEEDCGMNGWIGALCPPTWLQLVAGGVWMAGGGGGGGGGSAAGRTRGGVGTRVARKMKEADPAGGTRRPGRRGAPRRTGVVDAKVTRDHRVGQERVNARRRAVRAHD